MFGDGGEAANVAEHYADFGFSGFDELRVEEQAADYFGAEVLAKGGAHAALFFFFDEGAIQGDEEDVGGDGDGGDGEIQPPAVEEGVVVEPEERGEETQAEPHEARRGQRHENTERDAKK